jgi:hypothetical protein
MKILRIILIISAITLISSKIETSKVTLSANKEKNSGKDNFTENPIAGLAVPNDNYLLQQSAVK